MSAAVAVSSSTARRAAGTRVSAPTACPDHRASLRVCRAGLDISSLLRANRSNTRNTPFSRILWQCISLNLLYMCRNGREETKTSGIGGRNSIKRSGKEVFRVKTTVGVVGGGGGAPVLGLHCHWAGLGMLTRWVGHTRIGCQ